MKSLLKHVTRDFPVLHTRSGVKSIPVNRSADRTDGPIGDAKLHNAWMHRAELTVTRFARWLGKAISAMHRIHPHPREGMFHGGDGVRSVGA